MSRLPSLLVSVAFALAALSVSPARSAVRSCPATEGSAYQLVLGVTTLASRAKALRGRAQRAGFVEAVVFQPVGPGTFDVTLFGFATRAAAQGTLAEAQKAGFRASIAANVVADCADRDHDWEAVLGHVATQASARRLLARAKLAGLGASTIERDGANDLEVTQGGVESTHSFGKLARSIESQGFAVVSFEPS